MSALSLATLMLAPALLAAAAYAALVALEHPDEATATRQWITLTRAQALHVPFTPPLASRPLSGETERPSSDFPDPFQLESDAPTPAATSRQARSKAGPAQESEEDEDLVAAATPTLPSPSSAAATPARPALRLLGTLRRNEHWIALVELDGATRRLQVGDLLPGTLGEVLAVHEDQIAIRHAGSTQTISMENYAAGSRPTVRPYARSMGLAPRSSGRRLIRPGGRR
ncbi:hypothetical protein I5R65_15115 [Herbaspirillum sp. AP02]|uniref:hypothetical protein n=1 Tax=unclassified Herbaspirillum TaxID=2624150 RepID=UPI0015D98B35|nr:MULTISPECIES: hypothetical protein [unclassified Herbaspirillum]MBG7620797.1 hypothetical protein [Herbaspirillum sp. AP02]NZD68260.1 hypothetical protein [Herbaspirillum sp. AP21]